MVSDNYLEEALEKMNKGEIVPEEHVTKILMKATEIFSAEDNLVEVKSPVIICGDIHGQYEDMQLIFQNHGEDSRYLFMGDYVDRGYFSLNTLLFLLVKKIKNADKMYLLRGNHESRTVTMQYGFYGECILHYGHTGVWQTCMDLFDVLPYAALTDKDIFSVHGGLSPELPLLELIEVEDRQKDIPSFGPFADLTWSDPSDVAGWRQNSRGAGYVFGRNEVMKFNHLNRIRLITRSHQLVQEGFIYHFQDRDPTKQRIPPGPLINVWSAPNYSYRSGNKASVLKVRYDNNPFSFETPVFLENPQRLCGGVPDTKLMTNNGYFA